MHYIEACQLEMLCAKTCSMLHCIAQQLDRQLAKQSFDRMQNTFQPVGTPAKYAALSKAYVLAEGMHC